MSLNLNRHGASMQEAWKKVCNEKSDTNWVLFGYEGTSFDLKLISTGKSMFFLILLQCLVKLCTYFLSISFFILVCFDGSFLFLLT